MIPSISENNGIAAIPEGAKRIYSVGISTGGVAEIRMAELDPELRIVATTIDAAGAEFARKQIAAAGKSEQIDVRLENVAEPLPYADGDFDFVYARLVLHYLPNADLARALRELHRILRIGGQLFVVVRSIEGPEPKHASSYCDEETGMTTYEHKGQTYCRRFHSEQSIQDYLNAAGFSIAYIKTYEELLCTDFERKQPASEPDVLIEACAVS